MRKIAFTALVLACCSAALAQLNIDGSATDPMYGGLPITVQDTQTNFGDSNRGRPDVANGSELDAVYGTIWNGVLYLHFAGNLESNFNKLEIFIDSRAGGQNRLVYENPGPENANLRRMSASTPDNADGLKFTPDFNADFWVSVTGGGDPYAIFLDYAELYVDSGNPGVAYYLGSGGSVCSTDGGALVGGDAGAPAILAAIDNRNVAGVDGGTGPFAGPLEDVKTGVELAIPLSAIGNPAGAVKVVAFINGQQHDFISNQLLWGLLGGGNLGEPRTTDLAMTAHFPFDVPVATATLGACCTGTSCAIVAQSSCSGTFLGANTNCDANPCDAIPGGRCCIADAFSGTCKFTTQAECGQLGGTWTANETCAGCPCLQEATGACCLGTTCVQTTAADCATQTGAYQGDFTLCTNNPCAEGACCLGQTCEVRRQFECTGFNLFIGVGTDCGNNPCAAPTVPNPHIAGGVINGWCNNCTPMTETAPGSRRWTHTVTGLQPNERFEFKITQGDGSWNNTVPAGPNSWANADANGSVTITYDSNFYNDGWSPTRDRINLSFDLGSWTAAGNFTSELGGADWNNASPQSLMTDQGGGIWYFETSALPAGNYEFKYVKTGRWDSISFDARSVGTANWAFTVANAGDTVKFWVDGLIGRAKIEVVAAPSGCAGDLNCDGAVNFTDIDFFVEALGYPGGAGWPYANCPWLNADANGDNDVNFSDIDAFVGLIGTNCP